jgi:hypothetical protein
MNVFTSFPSSSCTTVLHALTSVTFTDLDRNKRLLASTITASHLKSAWSPALQAGPGGLRAPTWPLPALCPGAFWKKSDLPRERINKIN